MTGLLERSFLAAVIIAVLIIIRAFLLYRLPKFTFQAAWAVVILRLLIPYSIPIFPADAPGEISQIINLGAKVSDDLSRQKMNKTDLSENRKWGSEKSDIFLENFGDDEEKQAGTEKNSELTSKFYLVFRGIWLMGMLAVSIYFLFSHLRVWFLYAAALPAEYPLPKLSRNLERTLIRRKVKVKVSDQIFAPITYGLFFPVIILPKSGLENEKQLRMVLAHEIVHIRRFDILYKWLLAAATVIHWFNPLVLAMYVLANRDIELSCDEAVIRRFENGRKKDYALALLHYEEKRMISPTVTGFGANAVKERMRAIMKMRKTSVLGAAIAVILVAGSTTAFAGAKDSKDAPKQLSNKMEQNITKDPKKADGKSEAKQYLCEPAYYTLEELEEAMGVITDQLEKGILSKEIADQMLAVIEEQIREVKSGEQVEKPSPVYNADGTPLVTSGGDQLYAKASEVARMNQEMKWAAEGATWNWADQIDSIKEDTVVTDKDMTNEFSYGFVQPDWYNYEEYEKYVKKQKEEYHSMLGEWGYNPTEGWYEWDEEKIEEACRQLDENLEFVKNGGKISKPDTDGTVFMASSSKFNIEDSSEERWVMTPEELSKKDLDIRMADKASENGKFDTAFLESYQAFGVTADKEKCLYFYEGKPVAGLWDAGVVMADGLAGQEDGIYLKGVREEGRLVGFEKITKEEFCELTGLTIK